MAVALPIVLPETMTLWVSTNLSIRHGSTKYTSEIVARSGAITILDLEETWPISAKPFSFWVISWRPPNRYVNSLVLGDMRMSSSRKFGPYNIVKSGIRVSRSLLSSSTIRA